MNIAIIQTFIIGMVTDVDGLGAPNGYNERGAVLRQERKLRTADYLFYPIIVRQKKLGDSGLDK